MITRNDCLILLSELEEQGIDVKQATKDLMSSRDLSLEVVKFINDHRQFEVSKFYEKMRKSYNQKHSSLYGNIVKEIDSVNEVLITLSALNTQILLFNKTVEDKEMFLKHSRFGEICNCLLDYSKTYNIVPCTRLLRLIKCDLKAFESMKKIS